MKMYLDVKPLSNDLVPDASELVNVEIPIYYSDLHACLQPSTWSLLPLAETGKIIKTQWGTVVMKLRTGEGITVLPDHAFLHTGVEPISTLAFSPPMTTGARLLTVVKHLSIEAMAKFATKEDMNHAAILQHWLISGRAETPYLVNRLRINSGLPKSIKWLEGSRPDQGLFCYIDISHKLHICSVTLSEDPAKILHKEVLIMSDHEYTSIDGITINTTRIRIACGSVTGHVYLYDLPRDGDKIVGNAVYFVEPQVITSVAFMPSARGIIFAAGLATGRITVCDIRLMGGPNLFHNEYMNRPVQSLAWPKEYGGLLTAQTDGLIISLSMAETSRHHFIRGFPSGTKAGSPQKRKKTGEFHTYWSKILCPVYRSPKMIKAFELPATDVATAGPDCGFTFDGGVVLEGSIAQLDMKAYLESDLFTWSFVEPPAPCKLDSTLKNEPGSKSAIRETRVIIENVLNAAVLAATTQGGIHVLRSGYFDFENALSEFWSECSGPIEQFVDSIAGTRIAAAAGCVLSEGSQKVFAYGSQLGIIHLHATTL